MKTKKYLIYADECYQIIGITFKVFKKLGFGHKEVFYQKALAEEFKNNKIEFKEQLRYKVRYGNKDLGIYVFDFLLYKKIIMELKQKSFISAKDIDQLHKYLKATNLKLGLIATFTKDGAKCKRVVNLK